MSDESNTIKDVDATLSEGISVDVSEDTTQSTDSTASSPTKQPFSKETIFAFALPQAVLKEEIGDAKSEIFETEKKDDRVGEDQGGASRDLEQASATERRLKVSLLYLIAIVAVCSGVYLFSDQLLTIEIFKRPAIDASGGVLSSAPSSLVSSVDETLSPAVPNEPLSAQNASQFSAAQLLEQANSQDPQILPIIVAEALRRNNQDLLRGILGLAEDPDAIIRIRVVRAFGDRSLYAGELNEEVFAMLLARLYDDDKLVRGFAAKALGVIGDKTALTKLRARLDVEESEIVQKIIKKAITALAGTG